VWCCCSASGQVLLCVVLTCRACEPRSRWLAGWLVAGKSRVTSSALVINGRPLVLGDRRLAAFWVRVALCKDLVCRAGGVVYSQATGFMHSKACGQRGVLRKCVAQRSMRCAMETVRRSPEGRVAGGRPVQDRVARRRRVQDRVTGGRPVEVRVAHGRPVGTRVTHGRPAGGGQGCPWTAGGGQGCPWTAGGDQGHPWPAGRWRSGLPMDGRWRSGLPMDGRWGPGSPMAGRSIWVRVAGGRPADDRVTLGRPVETRVALGRLVQTSHPEGQGYSTLTPPPRGYPYLTNGATDSPHTARTTYPRPLGPSPENFRDPRMAVLWGGGRRWVALRAIANPIQNRSRRRHNS
jgi:hypothetical protein